VPAHLLPLFPLPLVLFPGATLPLHIFEPRYRQLLADCSAGDRRFGIVLTEEGGAPAHVGCVAMLQSSEALADGRSNIVVTGGERFAIERMVPSDRLYGVAEIADYVDEPEPDAPLAAAAARVRAAFSRVARAARTIADSGAELPSLPDEPALVSFTVASLIDLDLAARQRLLVSRSARDRLTRIEELLARALEPIESRAVVHARAKSNGTGPHAPETA
jgi:Lon protease-like protein